MYRKPAQKHTYKYKHSYPFSILCTEVHVPRATYKVEQASLNPYPTNVDNMASS
jgi:hypothetical protein